MLCQPRWLLKRHKELCDSRKARGTGGKTGAFGLVRECPLSRVSPVERWENPRGRGRDAAGWRKVAMGHCQEPGSRRGWCIPVPNHVLSSWREEPLEAKRELFKTCCGSSQTFGRHSGGLGPRKGMGRFWIENIRSSMRTVSAARSTPTSPSLSPVPPPQCAPFFLPPHPLNNPLAYLRWVRGGH